MERGRQERGGQVRGTSLPALFLSDNLNMYTCKSGVVYDGRWKDDARHGFGTCSYANGDVYKGKWKANQKHGDGSYLFHNGNM
jgi:hypothetical protein